MNINSQIHINPTLSEQTHISIEDLSRLYDIFMTRLNAFSAINEILAECGSTSLDAGKLYFLLSNIETNFNDVLIEMEQMLTGKPS